MQPADRILILDFGAQYTQLIARNLRAAGVYCEIVPHTITAAAVRKFAPRGIILSGGHGSTYADNPPRAPAEIFAMGIPILGICYGMQTLVAHFGGAVTSAVKAEYGRARVQTYRRSELLGEAGREFFVWMSHADEVICLPEGFQLIAVTDNAAAAIADPARKFYGVQFHPETTHSEGGQAMLTTFARDICGCKTGWRAANIIHEAIADMRARVGDEAVVLGLSGGVDSAVAAALIQRAVGDQLTCIFVDTGLLRLNEADTVMRTFAEHLGVQVRRVDAADRFLTALAGIADAEEKRKIIGREFVEVFETEARKIPRAKWLAQGTIYTDVVESSASPDAGAAKLIKSHHNVGGLPARMRLKLLEPLRRLFKDEVRRIGVELGLPARWLDRHPFPGPGLGVRILGEVTKEYADMLRQADAIFIRELEKHNLYNEVSQAFAVFLPVKSVGVVGDNRAYEHIIALRAVESVDFMTANWKRLPPDFLDLVARRIANEVRGVGRVVYDISNKPPATIEWE